MRATQQWLIKTCIHCMIIWSLLNMIILLVNKYGQIFHIPKSREYLCYTLLIVLFVLIRFPVLLSRFEAIESGKIGKQTDNGERNKKSGARATDTIKLPKLVTNPELALLIKEYKRKKVRTISMYCCVGIAFVVGFTSLFFTLFVYDFSGHVSAEQALICQLAAAHAVANPYSVTEFGFGKPKGNYDEARVPDYVLPDALCCEDGSRVKTQRQWERKRRPEILRSFTDEVYGRMPEGPYYERFELLEVKEDALGGLATRKRVRIYLDPKDKVIIDMLVYTPKNAEASPLFLGMNFFGNSTISHEEDIHEADAKDLKRYGDYRKLPRGACAGRWPLEKILSAGYGVATYYCGDVDPDYDDSFTKGAQSIYPNNLGKVIGPDQWGTLACWAWGLSRAMDYLCTDSDVDASRVALVGHSRLAKAALWAAATDRRFAMVAANESGCGGAALSRRAFGETVGIINRSFPHWFCDNFKKYSENEQALPVDQHELLALIAPRPLCVGSAADDLWSDPKGERLSLEAAVPVYELYGKGCSERLGYHIREGRHEIKPEDWDQYLRHADKWLK